MTISIAEFTKYTLTNEQKTLACLERCEGLLRIIAERLETPTTKAAERTKKR